MSFEITMTQAKESFMKQMARFRHKAQESEHFGTDTPCCEDTDAIPIMSNLTEQDIDEELDPHAQETSVG